MSISDIIQIVISIISFIGIVLNLLLWVTTRDSLKEVKIQNENYLLALKNDAMNNITNSHQTIFLSILDNPKVLEKISRDDGSDSTTFSIQMIATLLINHCSAIYLYAIQNSLDEEDWNGIQNDIEDLFSWPIIKERWPKIRSYYSVEFQELIDSITLKGRRIPLNNLKHKDHY